MKNSKRILSAFLALLMVMMFIVPSFSYENTANYTITNPYSNIDFSTVKQYKTALHDHTNASDGDQTLKQSLERHAECGFDIVAVTDHGTVDYTWETNSENNFIHGLLKTVGKSEGELEYLGKDGTFSNGTSYTYSGSGNDYYLTLDNGQKILRVNYGIENNAVSVNAHVNSWFVDYHDNSVTTYEDAVKGVDKLGGLSVINHPGEYSKARYELHSKDAYNTEKYSYWYFVNKISSLLEKYDTCIGVDINSKGDARTRFDRVFWDTLLQRFADNGENVYAICSSDAHQLNKINTGFTYALMQEQTNDALKKALANGEFFGASHCIGNPEELEEISAALKEYYGETDIYKAVKTKSDEINTIISDIENGSKDANSSIGEVYSVLDDDGYYKGNSEPMITSVAVDDNTDSITISTSDALLIRWISNGKLIATTKADGTSFKLGDYKDALGNYVRAEVFGEGGIVYTQAFLLNAEQNKGTSSVVDKGYFDFGFLDFLFGVFQNWQEIIGRM